MNLFSYIYSNKPSGLTQLSEAEYRAELSECGPEKAKLAFEKAWATRNFEIEMYWKRATYFWTFIATTFAGYFLLVRSTDFSKPDPYGYVEVYFLACFGFVLSFAWLLTNIGSKAWQRHWEAHVDFLEDPFTGPLYKTVHPTKTFSVSKINEIVSFVVVAVWVLLAIKYLVTSNWLPNPFSWGGVNWFVVTATVGALLSVFAMVFGHGRGRFGHRPVAMYRRGVKFLNPNPPGV